MKSAFRGEGGFDQVRYAIHSEGKEKQQTKEGTGLKITKNSGRRL